MEWRIKKLIDALAGFIFGLLFLLWFSACDSASLPSSLNLPSLQNLPTAAQDFLQDNLQNSQISQEYEEIRIATAWQYLYLFEEQIIQLQQDYNINLLEIAIENILEVLQSSIMSGEPFADVVLLSGDMMFSAITDNLIYALDEFIPQDSAVWRNRRNLQDLQNGQNTPSRRGRRVSYIQPTAEFVGLHWAIVPYTINIYGTFLGVNLDILNSVNVPNPATLYQAGNWNFDQFSQILQQVEQAENGYFGISGNSAEIITHLIAANDGVLTQNFYYAYEDYRTIAALEFARQILQNSPQGLQNEPLAFLTGESAFFPLNEWILQQVQPTGINFRYTIVPFPRGPDNTSGATFMQGFSTGLTFPRNTQNATAAYYALEQLFSLTDRQQLQSQETEYMTTLFTNSTDAFRAVNILQEQGKFDIGMAIPTFTWLHAIFAETFTQNVSQSSSVPTIVEQFRRPQQNIIDTTLENWIIRN
ncbi:MAG: extracellular solute-binding protein [Firmicutes bacterium]|nr:extracellular solute-binding protein [Bacillota bacterium]